VRVGVAEPDPQQIAARHGLERFRAELLAELRDEALEGLRRRRWRLGPPELLDQPVARDRFVRVDEQHSEELSLPAAADTDRAVAVVNLEWAENRVSHPCVKATVTRDSKRGKGGSLPRR